MKEWALTIWINSNPGTVVQWLSHGWLFATPWTAAHQVPLFMGFSRQEYWSGLHALLQGIFPTQGSNLCFLHCRRLLPLSHLGSPAPSIPKPQTQSSVPRVIRQPQMGKLSSFLCQLSPPRDSLSSLHNSLLKSEPWLSQKLKMFYFCPLIWNHVLQVIQQGLHPGNKGLFPNIVWGLSSNVPLRPLTLFPRLTSVTHRHHKAQFTKGTSKVGSTPKDENQRDKKVVVQGSRSSGPKFPASRCLELSPWNGCDAQSSDLVLRDYLEGWGRMGGGKEVQEGGDICL